MSGGPEAASILVLSAATGAIAYEGRAKRLDGTHGAVPKLHLSAYRGILRDL